MEGNFDLHLRIKVMALRIICIGKPQCFPPTHYVMGGATRVQIRDDLYPICIKLEYGEPVSTV